MEITDKPYTNEGFDDSQYICEESDISEFNTLHQLLFELDKHGITADKRYREFTRFLRKKAWLKGVPLTGSFELTPNCNLDCNMCYVHACKGHYSDNDILPSSVWINLIDQACEMGMMFAQISGGECLTYPDFDKIYLHLRNKGINTSILSNGTLIDEKRVQFFIKNKPSSIQISLYGSNDDSYELVTGHRVFQKVINSIHRLRESGINITVAVTISRPMISDIYNLIRLLTDMNIPYNCNDDLIPPYHDVNREFKDLRLTTDEIIEIRRSIMEARGIRPVLRDINKMSLPLSEIGTCEIGTGMPCGSGRSTFSINWKGEMMPCNTIETVKCSLLSERFKDAWGYINKWAVGYSILQGCDRCDYSRVCRRCPLMHEICTGIKGSVDTRYCNMVRRCVAEGLLI